MRNVSSTSTAFKWAGQLAAPRVLVPTMGALHAGHIALLKKARQLAGKNGSVIVSIFVNPIQFGPKEDLAKYPRPRQNDLAICEAAGVDLVFTPEPAGMYAADHSVFVDEAKLSLGLCGASRPGHFRGVCTVVARLFHILQPQIAVFGEKDYQQLTIIRRMVRDLYFPVRIVGLPTVREKDGLALSSRNQYLTPAQRADAPAIREALLAAQSAVRKGETATGKLIREITGKLEQAGGKIDYVSIVHAETLEPLKRLTTPAICAVAVKFGNTRLIDNCKLS